MEAKTQSIFTYLALGDSYTLGEGVATHQSWPMQLADRLKANAIKIKTPTVIAKTGWRTDELLENIKHTHFDTVFDLVTLQIGVNNQYQDKPFLQYKIELEKLLDQATKLTGNDSKKVVMLSIPDYSVTPFARTNQKNISKISDELKKYNHTAQQISLQKGIIFIDITHISKKGLQDTTLLASDKLHPSSTMYKLWLDAIFSDVLLVFER